jgi:ActR/RegA family two-component response regulator
MLLDQVGIERLSGATTATARRGRLLLVEPDPATRAFLAGAATNAGFDVRCAERREDVLLANLEGDPGLVLVDVSAGAALIAGLSEAHPARFIALTGRALRPEQIRAASLAGASSVLPLPASEARVDEFLRQGLRNARELQQRRGSRVRRPRRPSLFRSPVPTIVSGFLLGILLAAALGWTQDTASRMGTALQDAWSRVETVFGASRQDALLERWAALEQLRMTRNAAERTRQFQERQLDELRWQGSGLSRPPSPAPEIPPLLGR